MRLILVLALSLLIHILLGGGLYLIPSEWEVQQKLAEVAQIELLEQPPKDQRLMVRETEPEHRTETTESARFVSQTQKRVALETQAQNTGLTKNEPQAPSAKSWLRQIRPPKITTHPEGLRPAPHPPDTVEELAQTAPSTIGESLPKDIALGSITALNTDQFRYYSFFARIEELVRYRWEEELRKAIDQYEMRPVASTGTSLWKTNARFILDREGRLVSAQLKKGSGLARFDLAAIQAFRQARVFPNPPQDLIQPNGSVVIDYSFSVNWSPRSLVHRE